MKRFLISLTLLLLLSYTSKAIGTGSEADKYKVKTIVIDAGHGGHDNGCSGSSSKEKHVALAIALKLGAYIEANIPGVKVIYTRKTDKFVELHERAAIANRNNADLFISIHCNASTSGSPHGTETYVMGLHKTEDNLNVAKRENSVILLEDSYNEFYSGFDPNSESAHIIFTLHQNAYLEQSILLASKVEDQFKNRVNRNSRGVKQAGFLVLYKTSMPSVLIEAGFLTNKQEEVFLNSSEGQDYMASALFRSFRDYKQIMDSKIHTETSSNDSNTDEGNNPATITSPQSPEPVNEKSAPKTEVKIEPLPETKAEPVTVKTDPPKSVPDKSIEEVVKADPEPIRSEEPKTTTKPAPIPVPLPIPKDESRVETAPVAVSPATPAGISFKVQFYASRYQYASDNKIFQPVNRENSIEMVMAEGLFKYLTGNFASLDQAVVKQRELRSLGFKDAFVVAYDQDKRITIAEAKKLLGQ